MLALGTRPLLLSPRRTPACAQHFFSLDDFAGHEIQTILEDGETEQTNHQPDPDADRGSAENQSVRPGSIVSNIEQRLDEIEGFQGDGAGEVDRQLAAGSLMDDPTHSSSTGAGGSGGGSSSGASAAEAQYMHLLEQMQHRDLTPADLQLLMMLEQQAGMDSSLPPFNLRMASASPAGAGGPSGAQPLAGGSGVWCSPPPMPTESSCTGAGGSKGSKEATKGDGDV